MSYNTKKNGRANYNSWTEILTGTSIPEGNAPLSSARFAQLVHIVGNSSSTGTSANPTTIASKDYTLLKEVSGNFTYIMKADPGSLNGDAVWQIKRIEEVGNQLNIKYADGDSAFDNIASNYLSETYS